MRSEVIEHAERLVDCLRKIRVHTVCCVVPIVSDPQPFDTLTK